MISCCLFVRLSRFRSIKSKRFVSRGRPRDTRLYAEIILVAKSLFNTMSPLKLVLSPTRRRSSNKEQKIMHFSTTKLLVRIAATLLFTHALALPLEPGQQLYVPHPPPHPTHSIQLAFNYKHPVLHETTLKRISCSSVHDRQRQYRQIYNQRQLHRFRVESAHQVRHYRARTSLRL